MAWFQSRGIMPPAGPRKRSFQPARKKARAKPRSKRPAPRARSNSGEAALASLAHDIRTPLTGILALAELLSASDIGERERRWATGIKSAAEHLAQLTAMVCDAVRSQATGLVLRQEPFSPRRLAETIGAALAARATIAALKSEVAIARDLPDQVAGDPVRLRAMIENLIDNAVKFTARGTIRFAVSARPARGRTLLVFAVSDSGIGISPAEMKKLFRPFAQASETVSRRYGGTGLGLVAVKRLAQAMGGSLDVESKSKRGSTFTLSIPAVPVKKAAQKGNGAARAPAAQRTQSLNILCAEDNPYGRVILNTILTEFGHRADFVGSGEAAADAVARGGYDLVLMDVTLTGIDGLEATKRIRALPGRAGRIPVIGISALGSPDDRKRAAAAGMSAYLVKPVTPAALAEMMAQAGKK